MAERLQQVRNSLTIVDSRTDKTYEVKIHEGREPFVQSGDIASLKGADGKIIRSYDPGYLNTISCTSKICYIDGDKGVLEYRGYPIEQLAEKSNFLEVSFLLIYGELPTADQYSQWVNRIMNHSMIHGDVEYMMKSFRYDSHPMGMLISTMAAMSTVHPEQNPSLMGQNIYNDNFGYILSFENNFHHIGGITTLAANAYRHRIGRSFNLPNSQMSYVENFLTMMDKLNESHFKPHPKLVKALDVLFILHADHEQNCSTSSVRHLTSSGVDVYSTIAGAAAALYGPKHGGANEAVLRMLERIKTKENIPQFIENVKNRKELLFGFGHRVYKSYDPRAKIVKKMAEEVFEVVGKEPIIELAMELERIALSDEYFIKRKLYPNVDFYSGVIYKAMGFPTDMFVILFTIPRCAGWLAHWVEHMDDKENKIVRPRQAYQGKTKRDYIPMEARQSDQKFYLGCQESQNNRRREVAEKH